MGPTLPFLDHELVLDRQNTDSKGICRKNCSVLGPTLPFLDHSPGSSGFEDLEDLGSETDKRGSEDQPSEAKSAPVVFFVKLVSQLLLCVLNLNFHFVGAIGAGGFWHMTSSHKQ